MATEFFKFFFTPTFHFSECASISSDTWERDTLQGNVAVTHTGFQASQHLFIMRRQINATCLLGFMQFMSIQLFVVCKPSCCLLLKGLTLLLF